MSDTSAATIAAPRRQPLDATAPRINPPGRPKPVYADRVKYDAKNYHNIEEPEYKLFKREYTKFEVATRAELLKEGLSFEPVPFGRAEPLWLNEVAPFNELRRDLHGRMYCSRKRNNPVSMLSEYLQGMDGVGYDSIKFDAVVVPMPDDLASLFADASCNMGQLLERDNFVCMMQMAGDGELGRKLYPAAMAWVWAMKKQTWNPDGPTVTENYRAFMEQRILETGYERLSLIEEHMNYVAIGRGRDAGEMCYDMYRLAQVRNYQWSRATSECYNLPPPSFYAPNDRLWPRSTPPRGCATESALDDEFALPIELVGAESLTWYCRKVISTGATCEVPPRDDKLIDTLRKAASRRDE
jgi:hypothetical protein